MFIVLIRAYQLHSTLLFQISVARSISKDGFKEGLENAYGIQCSYNDWDEVDKWIQLKNEWCNHQGFAAGKIFGNTLLLKDMWLTWRREFLSYRQTDRDYATLQRHSTLIFLVYWAIK